ncbi:MAG: T9SS type A sorting domain-containing protein [Ignavibacteriae bacterium]|nr:T9SS type A sorting domain-containing protein [Ignavibacteriota bacterium]
MTASFVQGQTWTRLVTTNDPSPRSNASAIYDPVAHRMIVFGGRTDAGSVDEVWSLELTTYSWQNITPDTGVMPAARFSQNAMYDSASHRMIIWSGQGAQLYNDIWAFDLTNNTWQELSPDGNTTGVPLKRYGTAAIFDPVTRRLVNFAGFTTSGRFDDTWYFHVDSLKWVDKTNLAHPIARCLHSATFAGDRREMIMYGGQSSGYLDDIWSLNADSFAWTDLTPSSKPSGRYFTSNVYIGNGTVVMFGGQTATGVSDELWQFSLGTNSWDSIPQGMTRPSGRSSHTAVYIPSTNRMIMFGGTSGTRLNDTWEFSFTPTSVNYDDQIPMGFRLEQNYPNPFNPVTVISFQLPVSSLVSLKIYNLLGQEVATLLDHELLDEGEQEMEFEALGLPSGTYFYRFVAEAVSDEGEELQVAERFISVRKMILVK